MKIFKKNLLIVIGILFLIAIPIKIYMEYNFVSKELEEEKENYDKCLIENKKILNLNNFDCKFSYRDSIFKSKKYLI